jgi:hypothetical protein
LREVSQSWPCGQSGSAVQPTQTLLLHTPEPPQSPLLRHWTQARGERLVSQTRPIGQLVLSTHVTQVLVAGSHAGLEGSLHWALEMHWTQALRVVSQTALLGQSALPKHWTQVLVAGLQVPNAQSAARVHWTQRLAAVSQTRPAPQSLFCVHSAQRC